jgi:iron complex outermembrane receptor protein
VPGQSLPLDGTLLWGAVVAALQGSGIDLSSLPAPQTADVATVLRALDTRSGTFATVGNAVSDVNALRPTITNSVEAAWTRLFGGRLVVDASAYAIWRKDFIAPLTIATPNVFLSTTSLASYLARFFPAEQAAHLAAGIGGVDGNTSAPGLPLGTVTPTGEFGGGDILLTYRNVGDVRFWGTDLALTYAAGEQLELRGSWSWVNNNFFGGTRAGEPDLSTNTPRQKALLSARYRVPAREGSVELRGRHVGGFRMADGVWNGHVPAFTVADLEAGLLLPGSPRARVTLTVQNLTNNRHNEFFAAPELGRLVLTRLQYRF